ncbi:3-hydroxyacyl-[acyl-carrier-protein] dehydratase [Hasllibacter halocynthiae]|uniref:3-hydroxyacyl-[acyl-carrier-protein] dehydratase FabZ n=1 Tax=Hasllibacter halocynthiae TaxID=595589 RepID=A0A2T0X840_9RHOB|nr:3-hydroxyacyl-ACP dehydratase FabZ [Hasllibacter halocynthiae]PRY95096.1 3-hydroxyacyl-[acyl-carrier-protein] dehydratase [Hasllibacter halocynthiae]
MTQDVPKTADIDLIKRVLPHRYPFLLVDRVIDIEAGSSATGIKNVTFNEPHFQGHFPSTPIMPGVTIIESMAQTSAVLVGLSEGLIDTDMLVYFMAIEKAKFRRMVVPGDRLEMRIEILRAGSKIMRFGGRGTVDGQLACEAEFTAMIDRNGGKDAA